MKVFLSHTDDAFPRYFGDRALAALRRHAEVVRHRGDAVLSGAALAEAAAGCQAIIAHRATPGTAELFAAAPDLRAFLRCAVDVSTVDIAAASAQGILVTHATPGFADAVAELALGQMLDLARGISDAVVAQRRGEVATPRQGRQLRGAVLGLVGYGRIARRLAVLAGALGMTVLAHDPHAAPGPEAEPASLPGLLARADFVVLLALSTPGTAGMMDAAAFAAMRPGGFFLNRSRGELVDEAALDARHLSGAALDVGSAPDQMPSPRLARRADVIATPHVGGLTVEATEHQAMDTVRQVEALAAGRMPEGALNAEAAFRLR